MNIYDKLIKHRDDEVTYNELIEACMTQNELHKATHQKELNADELQKQIELLHELHTYAMCFRRIKEIKALQHDITQNINDLIDGLKD